MEASTPMVMLAFGDARAEFLLPDEGLQGLAAAVEAQFGLHPKSYGIFDAHGSLESNSALTRSVRMAACDGHPCALQVRESPEWQRMREMQEQIERLSAAAGASHPSTPHGEAAPSTALVLAAAAEAAGMAARQAMSGIEERIMSRVDVALSELRVDLSQADQKATAAAAVATLVKHLAIEHIDLKASAAESTWQAHQQKEESLDLATCRKHMDLATDERVAAMEEEIESLREKHQLAQHGLKTLQAEVRHIGEQRPAPRQGEIRCADWTVPFTVTPAAALDTSGSSFAYSRKSNQASFGGSGPAPPSPFARGHGALPSPLAVPPLQLNQREQRLTGCRSLPQLKVAH